MELHHDGIVAWVDLPATGRGPLDGRRVGIKEIVALKDVVRTAGAPRAMPAQAQPADAEVVARIRRGGGSVVAVTTSHALAYGLVTPQTRNPRAPSRVAGGSSGGSAAALALGLVDLAIGTDTGGSVRIPAACCGVVGLKTTWGRIPLPGVLALAPSLDTVGPMGTSVADTATLFAVMDGSAAAPPGLSPPDLRVGLPRQVWDARMDEEVRTLWLSVVEDLRAAGASVVPVDVPALQEAGPAVAHILGAEALAQHGAVLAELPQAIPEDVRGRLEAARALTEQQVDDARAVRRRLRAQLSEVFERLDVLCTPVLPCLTPAVDTDPIMVGGLEEAVVRALTRFTNPFNLAGVPAGSVPAGRERLPSARGRAGAPMAVQLVGPEGGDTLVLAAMAAVEDVRGGPLPPVGARRPQA